MTTNTGVKTETQASKRTVLVTGGSSGIGKSIVERFARSGYSVWFTYRTGKERAMKLAESLGNSVKAFHFEQGLRESHDALLRNLPGPVDIL